MKPRILILMHYMELGGAESALIGLLQNIDIARVDVDLFVYDHRGDLFPLIPTNKVNLLPQVEAYSMIERPLVEVFKCGYFFIVIGRLIAKWQTKKYRKKLAEKERRCDISVFPRVTKCIMEFLPMIQEGVEYDLAISFLQPHNILLEKVRAKKRLAWIHTDYSTVHVDAEKELKIWEQYDYIASISNEVSKAFLKTFPSLKEKIVVIENILSPEFVRARAKYEDTLPNENSNSDDFLSANCSAPTDQTSSITLLSIGRICYPKNYDNIPYIAKALKERLKDNKYGKNSICSSFKWYIIGPGDHTSIDEKLKEQNVDDCVFFIGPRSNPYPYLKACDIYVQPSRYEGKSVTVREAQVLCKPVIITNYPTAKSQINDGVDGVICGMDNNDIADSIYYLANDLDMRNQLTKYLKEHDYGNEKEIEKIYDLI